jgi:hypothetical protein
MRRAMYGLAGGAALAAAAAWLLSAAPTAPQALPQPAAAVPAPLLPDAARPGPGAAAQAEPPVRPAEPRTSAAVFEARFKASREAPPPPPNPALLQARSFPEAFQAMKRADSQLPAQAAGENPFGAAR